MSEPSQSTARDRRGTASAGDRVGAGQKADGDLDIHWGAAIGQYVEMAAWVGLFDALAWTRGTQRLLDTAGRWATDYQGSGADGPRDRGVDAQWVERAEALADRVSRLIPGARCLHRALASRVWLARRGVSSEVVIGFRKGGGLEGHAWLEAEGPSGVLRPFYDDSAGWREVLRG